MAMWAQRGEAVGEALLAMELLCFSKAFSLTIDIRKESDCDFLNANWSGFLKNVSAMKEKIASERLKMKADERDVAVKQNKLFFIGSWIKGENQQRKYY